MEIVIGIIILAVFCYLVCGWLSSFNHDAVPPENLDDT
jgi:hypothetical protein